MTLQTWQRSNILGAVNYLRDVAQQQKDARADALAQGLLEVLEPARRAMRMQREAAHAAAAAAPAGHERRAGKDRRRIPDRRRQALPVEGLDRRRGKDRRSRADRRSR